jgi:putative hydrolase of the HAD superfamily
MTLFRDDPEWSRSRRQIRFDAFREATGVVDSEIERAFNLSQDEFIRHHVEEQQTLEPHHCIEHMAAELNLSLTPEVAEDLARVFGESILQHPPQPIDDALEAVQAAAACCPIGIISDAGLSPGYCLRELLQRNGLHDHFTTLVFSDDVGVSKPQRAMFEAAAEGLGVALDEILHIGDLQPTDIAGAQAVGAQGALFTAANDKFLGDTTAEHTFLSWRAFVERLPELVG